jgi:hypothetical protein
MPALAPVLRADEDVDAGLGLLVGDVGEDGSGDVIDAAVGAGFRSVGISMEALGIGIPLVNGVLPSLVPLKAGLPFAAA